MDREHRKREPWWNFPRSTWNSWFTISILSILGKRWNSSWRLLREVLQDIEKLGKESEPNYPYQRREWRKPVKAEEHMAKMSEQTNCKLPEGKDKKIWFGLPSASTVGEIQECMNELWVSSAQVLERMKTASRQPSPGWLLILVEDRLKFSRSLRN